MNALERYMRSEIGRGLFGLMSGLVVVLAFFFPWGVFRWNDQMAAFNGYSLATGTSEGAPLYWLSGGAGLCCIASVLAACGAADAGR